jgi:hypothetical protein
MPRSVDLSRTAPKVQSDAVEGLDVPFDFFLLELGRFVGHHAARCSARVPVAVQVHRACHERETSLSREKRILALNFNFMRVGSIGQPWRSRKICMCPHPSRILRREFAQRGDDRAVPDRQPRELECSDDERSTHLRQEGAGSGTGAPRCGAGAGARPASVVKRSECKRVRT